MDTLLPIQQAQVGLEFWLAIQLPMTTEVCVEAVPRCVSGVRPEQVSRSLVFESGRSSTLQLLAPVATKQARMPTEIAIDPVY